MESEAELRQSMASYLTKLTGVGQQHQFAERAVQIIADSEKANRDKLALAKAQYQSYTDQRARFETDYHRLESYSWLRRFFSFAAKRRLLQDYPQCVETLGQSKVEIAARQLLDKEIFPGVQAILDEVRQNNQVLQGHIVAWRSAHEQEANRLKTLAHEFYVPVGLELIDGPFMDGKLEDVVAQEGGQEELNQKLFMAFKSRLGDLAAFHTRSIPEVTASLLPPALLMAQQGLDHLSVQDLFSSTYPTVEAQLQQVEHMTRESDGRVRTVGEADIVIPKIKVILVPDDATGKHVVEMANRVNSAGGEWISIVVPGIPLIGFCQYRCGVSLSQQIADTRQHYHRPLELRLKVKLV